jgi:pilus assembly protein CpaE
MDALSSRKIHVLVLRGEPIGTSPRGDAAAAYAHLLRAEPALHVTVKMVGLGQAGQVARSLRPDVILLDGAPGDPVRIVTELDEALGDTPVLVLLDEADHDQVHACVVAGARGCLLRPVDPDILADTIVQVHEKASRRRRMQVERPASAPPSGHLIAVRGTKGGVGTTAIATSLAVAIQRRSKQPTVLVDGHFFGGDVPVALNLAPNRSLVDLTAHFDRLDDDLLEATLAQHASGVEVLAGPPEFEQAEAIRADQYQAVLEALRDRFAYVVVDCSPFLDQNSLAALDLADTLLLVTTPELAALKNAARVVQLGLRLGYSGRKMRLIVNRFNLPGAVAAADFEGHLEYRTSFRVPNDAGVASALTRGEPVVTLQPASPAARALDQLARALISGAGWEGEPRSAPPGLVSRLARWRPFASSNRLTLQPIMEKA